MQEAVIEKGTYILEEFDRTCVSGTHSGNQLKKFVKCAGFYKSAKDKEVDNEVEEEVEEELGKEVGNEDADKESEVGNEEVRAKN